MDQLRTTRLAREIQKELSELFLLETRKTQGLMISVTEVRLTPDLSQARVFLSIFPDDRAEEFVKAIQERSSTVRYDLGNRMASQLRRIPDLLFVLDKSAERAARIDDLLREDNSRSDSSDNNLE